ncbi:MAG: Uma2 family endonuclease [Thermoflexales bacterium]|nr:Uma2 family endonuclease [Thermoflexales bacterium]
MVGRREQLLELLREPEVVDEELRREILEALLGPPRPRRMTYEEFLTWADEDTLAEWVEGEVEMYSPASLSHQRIVIFLTQIMSAYVESQGLGLVIMAPFQMKLAGSGREPDLMFVATEHLDRLRETYMDGPADLVVEVTSPESIGRDRGEKFYEYARAGIPEYWLIDPEAERAEFYVLDHRGRYQIILPDAEGIYRSRAIEGFWLREDWLWKPPRVLDVLRELGVL